MKKGSIIKKDASFVPMFSSDIEDNMIKAVVTTFGNVDKVGDVMEHGCLDNFIRKFDAGEAGVVRMLFNHNRSDILGKWTKFEKKDDRVIGYGKFSEVSRAKDVKTWIEDGIIDSVSVGFKVLDYSDRDDADFPYAMNFKEIELFETSIVDMPCNDKATILETKDFDPRFIERILVENGFTRNRAKLIISNVKKDLEKTPSRRDAVVDEYKILQALNEMRGAIHVGRNPERYQGNTSRFI